MFSIYRLHRLSSTMTIKHTVTQHITSPLSVSPLHAVKFRHPGTLLHVIKACQEYDIPLKYFFSSLFFLRGRGGWRHSVNKELTRRRSCTMEGSTHLRRRLFKLLPGRRNVISIFDLKRLFPQNGVIRTKPNTLYLKLI